MSWIDLSFKLKEMRLLESKKRGNESMKKKKTQCIYKQRHLEAQEAPHEVMIEEIKWMW